MLFSFTIADDGEQKVSLQTNNGVVCTQNVQEAKKRLSSSKSSKWFLVFTSFKKLMARQTEKTKKTDVQTDSEA
jgi:hypothetical protein